jgi:metal-responsive CopG/Arc/MetJ family transcriptional regulator
MPKTTRIYIEVPTYLDNQLKALAEELVVPRSQVIRAAIERYLIIKNRIKERDGL